MSSMFYEKRQSSTVHHFFDLVDALLVQATCESHVALSRNNFKRDELRVTTRYVTKSSIDMYRSMHANGHVIEDDLNVSDPEF